jgi:ankyrin repeat protein
MSPKRQAQVSAVELQQEHRHGEESNNKCARGAEGNDQQEQQQEQPGINLNCKQSIRLPPPPQTDDPIIMQFRPVTNQWELNDENINCIDPETGHTILHNYCRFVHTTPLAVYRYLIETLGCDVNAQDDNSDTPLHIALCHFNSNEGGGDITVLNYLLTQETVNANIRDDDGNTILHYVCKKINIFSLEIFQYLIEKHGADVHVQGGNKNTPLHYALYRFNPPNGGSITVLMYLLKQKNVDGNIKHKDDDTLLHRACHNIKHLPLDVFKLLIETHGCNINAQANNGDTPLHIALKNFYPNKGGDINVLAYLLSQVNVNGNIKGMYGCNLLHLACEQIKKFPIQVFKILIESIGCDVNAQDKYNNTPLHSALRDFNPSDGGDISVLRYLLNQKGVNVNLKGLFGYTLLHMTCININKLPIDVFKCLIERMGCDINALNNRKDTPIHLALENFNPNDGGDIDVLTYLLHQKNVDLNINNIDDTALLHSACKNINRLSLGIFKCLIETMGCDINELDNDNNTPLHNALEDFNPNKGGDITVLTYLLTQKNVNVNIRGKKGHNLLHLTSFNDLPSYKRSVELNAKFDSILCQIVEIIAERCVQHILDETTS